MAKSKTYNADPTIKVGDYVLSHYKKNDMWAYKVVKVHRRYLTNEDISFHPSVYGDCCAGEEMNPLLVLEKTFDLSFKPAKASKKPIELDAAWVTKLDKKRGLDYILRLQTFIDRL